MKPYYQDNDATIYNLNFLENDLPDESVQMVVTSPPYWGLRKYAGEQDLIWDGDKDCRHEWITERTARPNSSGGKPSETNPYAKKRSTHGVDNYSEFAEYTDRATYTNTCSLCGAWKGAYGLEPTPEMYVQHTVEILRELRRVLRKDGCVFWNIGDTYWGGKGSSARHDHNLEQRKAEGRTFQKWEYTYDQEVPQDGKHNILKPKDLCLIPFRVAIAAQEDGWWVRSIIIWNKPNPMPESVTDRPTESHEYILMLTKSARYYWDQDAVRATSIDPESYTGRRKRYAGTMSNYDNKNYAFAGSVQDDGSLKSGQTYPNRNIRSVWSFPTQPYPEAHFAVFPEKLPELCIKAATPEVGCCSKCGSPWERITEHQNMVIDKTVGYAESSGNRTATAGSMVSPAITKTIGWQPTCGCNADKAPSAVLDPFQGAGTTLWVAKKLNRKAIGFDISGEYCELAVERNRQQVLI